MVQGKAWTAGLLLAAALATGGAAADREKLRYQIEVDGMRVGTVEVSAESGADQVWAQVGWEMAGPLGLGGKSKGRLEGKGRVSDGQVVPTDFASRSKKNEREREVRIDYAADGSIEDLELNKNGKRRHSEVPEDQRKDTVDTLTALWRLRRWAAEKPEPDDRPLELQVFDGQERYDLVARATGTESARLGGHQVEAERIELTLVPKAGLDDGEVFGSRVDPDKPWAELLVTPGDDPVLLKATGQGRRSWTIGLDRE
jgi:hypothetical protein